MASDPKTRFTRHAEYYSKYRPNYPASLLDFMERELGLSNRSIVADVGSGTGILAKMLLQNGNVVFGVEPNDEMRSIAEANLSGYRNFRSVGASAESTMLPDSSVDYVTCAQSFHWFDRIRARKEFQRILKENGWVVLVWNSRRTSTPFLRAYNEMVRRKPFEQRAVHHEDLTDEILSNFLGSHRTVKVPNIQDCDEESFKGRVLSASYSPLPGDTSYEELLSSLSELFERFQVNGRVRFEYDTEVYAGQLR
ncbi:MAG TPA: class I SAM-dependent methyltransferase [Candidatus Acidoferrales bacterium]|nr:class I SAM-dependent methyltransferase [Candidatus Acidoferrales bacterium]